MMNDRPVTKDEALQGIRAALTDAEDSIRAHPPETVALYQQGKALFVEAQSKVEETEWSHSVGLTLPELATMHQYLLASAFMATWFHMQGDKSRRDKAAQAACLLVLGLGFQPKDAMQKHIQYEQIWRKTMRHSGAPNGKGRGCLSIMLLALLVSAAATCLCMVLT